MNRTLMATEVSHLLLSRFISAGETAVDATAGNGNDTLFLAQLVGRSGKVYAFDIQAEALETTRRLLQAHNCLEQVTLIHDGHEKLDQYVKSPVKGWIYNLGYLPGGDKSIITEKQSTLSALRQSVELTVCGGIISVVAYPGHCGGDEETRVTKEFLTNLPSPPWDVLGWKRLNKKSSAPCLLMAHKQFM